MSRRSVTRRYVLTSQGAAILYMLMKELGQPVFKAGLHKYLMRHKLGNAETDDLWAAIQEAGQEASEANTEDRTGGARYQGQDGTRALAVLCGCCSQN